MRGTVNWGMLDGRETFVYLPPKYAVDDERYPVVYLNEGSSFWEETFPALIVPLETAFRKRGKAFLIASLAAEEDAYSPWPAEAATPKSKAFHGGAEGYLRVLTERFKPLLDREYRTQTEAEHTAIMGYSLGGLCALYALYQVNCFGRIAALSGSLWFEGFVEFMQKRRPACAEARCYLSLGRAERKVYSPVLSTVADRTEEAVLILREALGPERVEFVWHNGGHFTEIPARLRAGFLWLLENW